MQAFLIVALLSNAAAALQLRPRPPTRARPVCMNTEARIEQLISDNKVRCHALSPRPTRVPTVRAMRALRR